MKSKTIYILCGLPGSGKSTWAKEKVKEQNTVIICRDAIRTMIKGNYFFDKEYELLVEACTNSSFREAIRQNYNIIIDETNISKIRRNMWLNDINFYSEFDTNDKVIISKETWKNVIDINKNDNYKTILVWFKEHINNLDNRVKNDKGISKETWKNIIENMQTCFEPPSIEEGFDEIIEIERT